LFATVAPEAVYERFSKCNPSNSLAGDDTLDSMFPKMS
jgi:hypothetical protein